MLGRIRRAQKTRCFDLLNKKVPRIWTLQQIGYTISSMFIRSYEQGERTYQSMLCRGYNADVHVYVGRKNLRTLDVSFLALTAGVIIAAHIGLNLGFIHRSINLICLKITSILMRGDMLCKIESTL